VAYDLFEDGLSLDLADVLLQAVLVLIRGFVWAYDTKTESFLMFVYLIDIAVVHKSLHQSLPTKAKWQFLGVGIRD
jgi:hypothetical protein